MHRAIASALRASHEELSLSVLKTRADKTLVLAYSHGSHSPVWIAKIAASTEACLRLEREHDALEMIRPWAKELNVPEALSWDCAPEEACLILSVVPGVPVHITLPLKAQLTGGLKDLSRALEWLNRLRERLPAGILEPLDGTSATLAALEGHMGECGAISGLINILRDASGGAPARAPSHGDFWQGNLQIDGAARLGVIDWDCLAARSPIHDILSLFAGCHYRNDGRLTEYPDATIFSTLFFRDTPVSRYLRQVIAPFGLSERHLRHAFYCFIGDSIRVMGQPWRNKLFEIARILERAGFPDPWTRPLNPASASENRGVL